MKKKITFIFTIFIIFTILTGFTAFTGCANSDNGINLDGKTYIDYGDPSQFLHTATKNHYEVISLKKSEKSYTMNIGYWWFEPIYPGYYEITGGASDSDKNISLTKVEKNKYSFSFKGGHHGRDKVMYLYVFDSYLLITSNDDATPTEPSKSREHFQAINSNNDTWYFRLVETQISDYMQAPQG